MTDTPNEMTVYDAVKTGLDAYPDVDLGAGTVYAKFAMDEGHHEYACAIGFIALGQCSPEDWSQIRDTINEDFTGFDRVNLGDVMYAVIDLDQRNEVFEWNDTLLDEWALTHEQTLTKDDYLADLKESDIGNKMLMVYTCDIIDRSTLGPEGSYNRQLKETIKS